MAKAVSQLSGALDALTTPVVIPPAFSPTDLPELELWLDANEGVLNSVGNNFTDATASIELSGFPLFTYNANPNQTLQVSGTQNEKNAYYGSIPSYFGASATVRWDGTQWELSIESFPEDGPPSYTSHYGIGNTDYPWQATWADGTVTRTATTFDVPATDGQSVRQWKNLVSGKPNVEQSSASIQPLYYDAWTEENKPSVLFNADSWLAGSGFSTWGSQFTYYVVGRDLTGSTVNGAGVITLVRHAPLSVRRGLFSVNTEGDIQASNGTLRTFSIFPNLNETEIFSMGFDITNDQVNATITNTAGTAEGSVSSVGTSSVTTNGITIGTANSSTSGSIYGEIREILVYRALHSEEIRDQISDYLSAKWGVFAI